MRFVVTEFSWDTKPPDKTAVPMKLHERWVSEALYRMYQVGIDLALDEAQPHDQDQVPEVDQAPG